MFLCFFLTFAFMLSQGFAQNEANSDELQTRVSRIETRVHILEKNRPKVYQPITPSAGPRVKQGLDIFLLGKVLYWTGRLDTLTYGKSGPFSSFSTIAPSGTEHSVDWNWDPGFQVGMGWNFAHGGWDMQLKYTWYYTKARGNTQETIHPSFSPLAFSSATANGATANWDLHYQLGDLEFGRNFFLHQFLTLRPFMGIKGTWQKQNYQTSYGNVTIEETSGTQINLNGAQIRFRHAIWGLGPQVGMHTTWLINEYFGFYGNAGLSGVWLAYTTERKNELLTDQPRAFTRSKKLKLTKPVIDLGIGLRIQTYFNKERFHFLVQFGWETQLWPSQTLYLDVEKTPSRFDLILHGGVGKIRFDF